MLRGASGLLRWCKTGFLGVLPRGHRVSVCQQHSLIPSCWYVSPSSWGEAIVRLQQLFPEDVQRGLVTSKLLPLSPAARLEYFQDTDESVKASLLSLAGEGVPGNGQIFKHLCIFVPNGKPGRPYTGLIFRDVARKELIAELRSVGMIGVVAQADWPQNTVSSNEDLIDHINLQLLYRVTFEDGGRYFAIYAQPNYLQQLQDIADWRSSWPTGMENEVRDQLVKQLQDSGHSNAKAYHGSKLLKTTGGSEVLGKIDAAAIADDCALIAKVTTTLSYEAVIQLEVLLDVIRRLVEREAAVAAPFKGKQLLGALAGRVITTHQDSRRKLMEAAASHQFPILLPNAKGVGLVDDCIRLSSSRDC